MDDEVTDVAHWQRSILDGDEPERGPAYYLFEASTTAFSALLQILAADSTRFKSESYESLRDEFRKFYMWNEGFSTRSGDLDYVLSCSKNLKATVIGLMVHWVKAVSKVPKIMSEYDWTSAFTKFDELQVLAEKADRIAKAAMIDMKSQCSVVNSFGPEDDSDSDSDFESSLSDYAFEDIIEDLNTYMESLADLSPSLDHPATDYVLIERTNSSLIDDLSGVSEPARPFALIIKDRFPSLEAGLVRKLGEANWQRRERLWDKLASAPEMEESSWAEDDSSSVGGTFVGSHHQVAQDQQTIGNTVRSSISFTNTFQSITIASEFSEPSIFDNLSISIPVARRVRPAESVTSFATSAADGFEHGQRRIPSLPEAHEYGSPFQCQICGDILTGVRNRADWKKHVYNDLEPYICLFTDCTLELHTFQSRREWKNHEFQVHRVNAEWRCNLCKETFEEQELFRGHIDKSHVNDIETTQIEEFLSASKRLIPCRVENELCPFCLTAPAQTQEGFSSHVGKHQQEISLAALPRLEDNSDDESIDDDQDSDNDDDDGNDRDDDGKTFGTISSDRTVPRRPSIDDFHSSGLSNSIQSSHHRDSYSHDKSHDDISQNFTEAGAKNFFTEATEAHKSQENWFDDFDLRKHEQPVAGSSDTKLLLARTSTALNFPLPSQKLPHHSHSLSQDNQRSIHTSWGPQNRLMFTIRGFEKTLEKCADLWKLLQPDATQKLPLLTHLNDEVSLLCKASKDLASCSSNLDLPIIEKSIETFAICNTQLVRLQKVLESTTYSADEPGKKSRRPNLTLRQLFTRQQAQSKFDLDKAQDILTELQVGRKTLGKIHLQFQKPGDTQRTSQQISPQGNHLLAEAISPQLIMSPTGTLHLDNPQLGQTSSQAQSLTVHEHAALADAIREGDINTVIEKLSTGMNIDEQLGYHGTALNVAALSGQEAIFQLLLDRGADVNFTGGHFGTALQAAAFTGRGSIVKLLLAHGADVNVQAGEYGNALQAAAVAGNEEQVSKIELLLSRGASVNAKGGRYGTALQAAVFSRSEPVVILLLEWGADVNAEGGYFGNALQAAAATGQEQTTRLLIERGANVNARGGIYYTALQAAKSGEFPNKDVELLLLKYGADPDIQQEPDEKSPDQRKSRLEPIRPNFLNDYQTESTSNVASDVVDDPTKDPKEGSELGPSTTPEDTIVGSEKQVDIDQVSLSESLKAKLDDKDDIVYFCRGCGEILEEGRAFDLAGNRWHIDCFRCNTCGELLDSDANVLLLGDGSLICNNCTYSCYACGNKIEELAILTGDQAFCADCFKCRTCHRTIKNLRYARTSQGIICMNCHESLMAKRRKQIRGAASSSGAPDTSDDNLQPLLLQPTGEPF